MRDTYFQIFEAYIISDVKVLRQSLEFEQRWRALTSDFDITYDVGFKNLEMGYLHHI